MFHDVFLSYSSKDAPLTKEVCAALERNGVKCWIAKRDIVGGSYGAAIVRAIRASKIVVLVLSSSANESPQVRREVERAVHSDKVIYTFRIENVYPSEHLELFISSEQWLDAWIPPIEDRLKQLAANIKIMLSEIGESASPPLHQSEANILVQTIGVSQYRDPLGRESFIYAPAPLGEVARDSVLITINWQSIQQHLRELRSRVEDLTRRALIGQTREKSAIEGIANSLARSILPEGGFLGMMVPGVNPQLDLIQDAASEIPWEVLEESYFTCSACHRNTLPHRPTETSQPYCERCGARMDRGGGKLAIARHVTHLVRGNGRPSRDGQQFLFIEDPNGDLCDADQDHEGKCRDHLVELQRIVKHTGYMVRRLTGSEATIEAVINALADPTLGGVYYFGHGFLPGNGDEGCLCLADGELFAGRITQLEPAAKFVFLNTCEGAATGRNWQIEKRSSSVAYAFARSGLGKVVIAPIWPMVSEQAAEIALELFRSATSSVSLGEALRGARQKSLQRYQSGEPHLAWMAYRFFGDPNRCFPVPEVSLAARPDIAQPTLRIRHFDERELLNTELFAFGIDAVLLIAARRRNHENRERLTLKDLISGLILTGDLTRYVLRQSQLSPNELYEKMVANTANFAVDEDEDEDEDEKFDAENSTEEQLREFLSQWIVRRKEEFDAPVISLLESADILAQQREVRTQDRRISEQDLLECLIGNEAWAREATDCGLPKPADVREVLAERELTGEIDENGVLTLRHLDTSAKTIIETAHVLAQQRGLFPIPHRLMFAAFLSKEKGCAATVCAGAGADPESLLSLMMAATEKGSPEDKPPLSFGLGLEACERIVLPVIEEAKRTAHVPTAITEEELFKAFCREATPDFKAMLSQPPEAVDLDSLFPDKSMSTVSLEGLDQNARKVIETAHALAQRFAAFPIPNRLLLAAFLHDPNSYASRLLRKQKIVSHALSVLLQRASGNGPLRPFVLSEEACARIITPTLTRARELSPGVITEQLLFKAFCAVIHPELKQALKSPPWKVDLDVLDFEQPLTETEEVASVSQSEELSLKPSQFEPGIWQILIEAARLAREQGWTEVRSPHLYAAMIGDGSGVTRILLQKNGLNSEEVKRLVLQLLPKRPLPVNPPPQELRLGKHVRSVVTRATQRAATEGRARVTGEDLLASFFSDGGGVVGEVLMSLGVTPAELNLAKDSKVNGSNNGNVPQHR